MNILNKLLRFGIFALLVLGIFFCNHPTTVTAAAESNLGSASECDSTQAYSGSATLSSGTFNVYLKLGVNNKPYKSQVSYSKGDGSGCTSLGKAKLSNGRSYSKFGTLHLDSKKTLSFLLNSESIKNIPDANRPSLLILPTDTKICDPKEECKLKYKGNSAYIRPVRTSLTENSLPVYLLQDPNKDTLKTVDYFVDNRYVYSSNMLSSFNSNYVPAGKHKTYRLLRFSSGQQIVIPGVESTNISDGFKHFIFSVFVQKKSFLQILTLAVVLTSALFLALKLAVGLYERFAWKQRHDATHTSVSSLRSQNILGKFIRFSYSSRRAIPILISILVLLSIISFVRSNGVKFVRVDGVSMQNTLQNHEMMAVSKIAKWWANFNGQDYIPKRGQVVVARTANSVFVEREKNNPASFVVKRVIGLPGERVVAKDNNITVYNSEHPKGFTPDESASWKKTMIYKKSLFPVYVDVTLKESEIFLVGDNRPGSTDSRVYGPVDTNDVYGSVVVVVSPINKLRAIGL